MSVLKLKSTPASKRKAVEREAFVEIDGVVYEVDKEFSASFALRYIQLTTERGLDAANIKLMKDALGDAGYTAIVSFADLRAEDLAGMIAALMDKVHKALEPGNGSASGS